MTGLDSGKVLTQAYDLPLPFPNGKAWAAIKNGAVVNMVYMTVPDEVPFHIFRQQSRANLAKQGKVVTREVIGGRFIARVES